MPTQIGIDDFVRRFTMRTKGLMWLLGAGASASAGIPTASDFIWQFKQQLYVSQRRVTLQSVSDLSNPAIRANLQSYIDSSGHFPLENAPEEYASLFEAAYPAEADRRTFIDAKLRACAPSYGHLALATLMRAHFARLVWTTNFDALISDACAKVFGGTGVLSSVALDAPDLAEQFIYEERWPIEVKMHGDFRSRRLKNTEDELRNQDARLRHIFTDSCRRFGLIVVGYSGRDNSIMETLLEAAKQKGAFPAGLFWLQRNGSILLPKVIEVLEMAEALGSEVSLVSIENFDETMCDLVRVQNNIDTKVLDDFGVEHQKCSPAPRPIRGHDWPVIRLNALEITKVPNVCRRVNCSIGGYSEVQQAVQRAGVRVLTTRTKAGVLAFGEDLDIRKVFDAYNITCFDLFSIEQKHLHYDSGERGLIREGLTQGLSRERNLSAMHRRHEDFLFPRNLEDSTWEPLKRIVGGSISGVVRGCSDLKWHEGIGLILDWADDRLWLLFEPRIIFDEMSIENKKIAAEFARERTVKRYNRQLNELVTFWSKVLSGDSHEFHALGISNGVDAIFRLAPDTAYSWRSQA